MVYDWLLHRVYFDTYQLGVGLGFVFQAVINRIDLALTSEETLPEPSLLCVTMSNEVTQLN